MFKTKTTTKEFSQKKNNLKQLTNIIETSYTPVVETFSSFFGRILIYMSRHSFSELIGGCSEDFEGNIIYLTYF